MSKVEQQAAFLQDAAKLIMQTPKRSTAIFVYTKLIAAKVFSFNVQHSCNDRKIIF